MHSKGYIYSILAAIFFGMAGIFIKLAYKTGLDSIGLLTFQYIMATIIMFAIGLLKDRHKLRVNKKELLHLMVLGVAGNTFMTVFYYKAFELLPVAMVAMLLYTYPVLVFIYLSLFRIEKITIKKAAALVAALTGAVLSLNLISGELVYSVKGIAFGVLSAVFYAFMNIYSEKHLQDIEPLTINTYSTMFSLLSLIIYRFPKFIFNGQVTINNLILTSILATFCEIIPLTLLYAAIKYIGSLKVSIISNLEIPTAMVVSFYLLNESVTFLQVIGAALIIFAVYMIR